MGSGLENLAELLAMGNEQKAALIADDPYLTFKEAPDAMGKLVIGASQNPNYSTRDKVIAGLLTGATSGLFKGLSDDYQGRARDDYSSAIESFVLGEEPAKPGSLPSSIFNHAKESAGIFKLQGNLAILDEKIKQQGEGKKTFLAAYAKADTADERKRLREMATELGYISDKKGGLASALPGGAKATEETQPVVPADLETSMQGPDLGVPTLQELYQKKFKELVSGDTPTPPIQASTRVGEEIKSLRSQSKSLMGDKIKDYQDTILQLEDMINKGEEGISKAGVTGSRVGSAYEGGLSWLSSKLGGGVFPEAEKQAAGDTLLSVTKNIGAAINRIKGTGSLSDTESKALFDTAMSPNKTNAENLALLNQYKLGLERAKEHSQFLEYFVERTGGNPSQANMLWDLYKTANPLVIKNEAGDFVTNENRVSWTQFPFKQAYAQKMNGGTPLATPPVIAVGPSEGKSLPTTDDGKFYIDSANKKLIPIK